MNGKVNQEALPGVAELRAELSGASEEAEVRSEVEEGVVGIWREVLGVERLGVGDNFFELGGHSLLATQVVTRVRERWGLEMGLRKMFERPTVRGLGEWIEAELIHTEGEERPAAERIGRVSRDGALPLSFAQQRLWFLDQLQPGSAAYNIPAAVRLTGSLNVLALAQTLNEISKRHEILRTSFAQVEGHPIQVISPVEDIWLNILDLTIHPQDEREEEALRMAHEEARRPFDLSVGPLLRTSLLQLGEDDHVLLFTMHHIISDGWSMGVLVREVSVLYEAFAQGQRPSLPELAIQYADFAAWQREWLQDDVLDSQLS